MSEYTCPGCRANVIADECWHTERAWLLAEALSVGLPGGPATWGDPVERAWQFIDDAEGLEGSVGAPPYAVTMFHPNGRAATVTTIGLVNGRYLFTVDEEAQFIGDVFDDEGRARLVMPGLSTGALSAPAPPAERQRPPAPASAYARGTFYVTGDLSVWEAVWDGRDKCPIWVFVKKLARGGDGAQLVMSEPSAVAT